MNFRFSTLRSKFLPSEQNVLIPPYPILYTTHKHLCGLTQIDTTLHTNEHK